MKNWWRADEKLMKNWWKTDEELMKHCWRTDEKIVKNWWRTDEELMKSWWRADEEVWSGLLRWTGLNTQTYLRILHTTYYITDSTNYESIASSANKYMNPSTRGLKYNRSTFNISASEGREQPHRSDFWPLHTYLASQPRQSNVNRFRWSTLELLPLLIYACATNIKQEQKTWELHSDNNGMLVYVFFNLYRNAGNSTATSFPILHRS